MSCNPIEENGAETPRRQAFAPFIEEIPLAELELHEILGRGAYGLVHKAKWREKIVAVKLIESEKERNAFSRELTQLARVKHENIVQLYGACQDVQVCLVMEYAEGGSLFSVLHGHPQPRYTAAHSMSWLHQCACGVAYLHSLQPKPLVHRDLKPPNLLLIDSGRKLKICDFGTACDVQTYMTNSKGSAAWMAPEVFEGRRYSEKCDVFSFGIIMWEVLTRRRPFAEIGGNAFSVMWAVHKGDRPPLIQNCPKAIELLMTECWHATANSRPAMNDVVRRLSYLVQFFPGADEPLEYPDDYTGPIETNLTLRHEDINSDTPPSSELTGDGDCTVDPSARTLISDRLGVVVPLPTEIPPDDPVIVHEDSVTSLRSAPASLGCSAEDLSGRAGKLSEQFTFDIDERAGRIGGTSRVSVDSCASTSSCDTTTSSVFKKGHRRIVSFDPKLLHSVAEDVASSSSTEVAQNTLTRPAADDSKFNRDRLHLSLQQMYPAFILNGEGSSENSPAEIPASYLFLHNDLQPIPPDSNSKESLTIFRQHCAMAEEYVKIQEEIEILLRRKQVLISELDQNIKREHQTNHWQDEYNKLLEEKIKLQELNTTLKKELEEVRRQRSRK